MAEKKSLIDFAKEATLVAAAVVSLTSEEAAAQQRQDNFYARKNRLELAKGKLHSSNIVTLIRNEEYDAAYNISFDSSKQGAIKNDYSDNIEMLRIEIEELTIDQALDSLNRHPEVREFLRSLDKENFYMNSLKSGKYKSIKDVVDNTYVEEAIAELGSTSTLATYYNGDKSIVRNILTKNPDKTYTEEQEEKFGEAIEMMNDKEYVGSLIAHELDHKKAAEEGVDDYEYTIVDGVRLFDVSLEDQDRSEQAKEISAEINAMIYFSERYQETGIVSKAMKKRFPAYAEAIEKVLINPKSSNPADNEKEIKFMCQIAQDDWDNIRKQKYDGQMYQAVKEYSRIVSDEQSEETKGNTNIRKESVPLTINRKMQKTFTFMYKGEKTNFSKHIDYERIKPTENTKIIKANFYGKIDKINNFYQEKEKRRTYDATKHFMENNEER